MEGFFISWRIKMATENTLVSVQERLLAMRESTYTPEQIDLIKKTIATGASDDEFKLFIALCKRTGLDPFNRQIYAIKRAGKMTFQVSIDGLRLLAERTGQYRGQSTEQWCGSDGKWVDVWTSSASPVAARVLIYREGWQPIEGKALWVEYAQNNPMWAKYPATMLVKCAEAKGLRKAFPYETSGLYASEEIESINEMPDSNSYPPYPIQNGNGKSSNQPVHYENEDELVYQERCRLFNKTIAYMKANNISPATVKAICEELGIKQDSLHMSPQQFVQLLNTLQERQEALEKQQAAKDAQEHAPLTQEETMPPPVNNDPPAPFTPPADPFDAHKEEAKKN